LSSRKLVFALALVVLAALLVACGLRPERSLVLATTTSTYDSGLLDAILPAFEKRYNANVRVIAVGSGEALALAERGDADVVLAHSPKGEEEFIAKGLGIDRTYVMYNDFVILGPPSDPAGIQGLKSASEAFKKIAEGKRFFASRGDESGTHTKEKGIWKEASIEGYEGQSWYLSLGQGMGETLTTANEKRAYVLSDRGTYLSRGSDLELVVLVEGDEALFNPYHVMRVNSAVQPDVQAELSRLFIEFLVSQETQKAIGQFGVERYGQPLFTPVQLESTGD